MALSLNYAPAKKLSPRPIERYGWTNPPEEMIKLNVDAAFDIDTGTGVLELFFEIIMVLTSHAEDVT